MCYECTLYVLLRLLTKEKGSNDVGGAVRARCSDHIHVLPLPVDTQRGGSSAARQREACRFLYAASTCLLCKVATPHVRHARQTRDKRGAKAGEIELD